VNATLESPSRYQLSAAKLAQTPSGLSALKGIQTILSGHQVGHQLTDSDRTHISDLLCSGWRDEEGKESVLKAVRAALDGASTDPRVIVQIALNRDDVARARALGAESDLSWDEAVHAAVQEALLGNKISA
jgi:hypothetical protein